MEPEKKEPTIADRWKKTKWFKLFAKVFIPEPPPFKQNIIAGIMETSSLSTLLSAHLSI